MKLLDGKVVSNEIYTELKKEIANLNEAPGLTVILVGNRKDSETYVNMKHKKCLELGIKSDVVKYDSDYVTTSILCDKIKELNSDKSVHGILIQLPLPDHLNTELILSTVALQKDVDGFHFENIGRLATNKNPLFKPCTPDGCIEILKRYNINVSGKKVVVIGRSAIVGLPLSLMLLYLNATVTICHSRTVNIEEETRNADIIIAACGRSRMVKNNWVKQDAVIIDIGINSIDDPTKKRGYRLVGDVDFDNVKDIVSHITPVPGGVGPMTIAMLMKHTVEACKNINNSIVEQK